MQNYFDFGLEVQGEMSFKDFFWSLVAISFGGAEPFR